MFKDILIQEVLPRDISSLSVSLTAGLSAMRFFGYFFSVSAIFLFSLSAFKFKMIFPSIFFVLLTVLGVYMINHVNQTVKARQAAFTEGTIVSGTVQQHGKKFNPFKSARDYTLLVKVADGSSQRSIEIVHKDKRLWTSSPVGSEIIGLTYNDAYFFGEEVGCKFKLE